MRRRAAGARPGTAAGRKPPPVAFSVGFSPGPGSRGVSTPLPNTSALPGEAAAFLVTCDSRGFARQSVLRSDREQADSRRSWTRSPFKSAEWADAPFQEKGELIGPIREAESGLGVSTPEPRLDGEAEEA